jgi:hypothetical protein
MADIFAICCDRLEETISTTESVLDRIESTAHLLDECTLHVPETIGGYSRIVRLVNNKLVPIELISISKSCAAALQRLPQEERTMLPSDTDLLRIRVKLLMNTDNHKKLRRVLGQDLLKAGVP